MTDRPRTWLLVECPDCGSSSSAHRVEGGPVDVVEWDREKVEAAATRALTELLDRKPDSTAYGMARAIFDALEGEHG